MTWIHRFDAIFELFLRFAHRYRSRMKPYLALLVTVVLWAATFPAIRYGLRAYAFDDLVLLRFLSASIVLGGAWLLRGRPLPRAVDLPAIVAVGIVGMTLYPLALSYGELTVSAGAASMLVNLSPVFTAILAALFLTERLGAIGWIGIAVAFSGTVILSFDGGREIGTLSGLAAVLAAALLQGIQFTLSKALLRRYDPIALTTFAVWSGSIANLIFLPGLASSIAAAPLSATAVVVGLGVFSTAIATSAWSYALARIPAPQAASFLYLVPPVAVAISAAWLGETISGRAVTGGLLSMIGVLIVKSGDSVARALFSNSSEARAKA